MCVKNVKNNRLGYLFKITIFVTQTLTKNVDLHNLHHPIKQIQVFL